MKRARKEQAEMENLWQLEVNKTAQRFISQEGGLWSGLSPFHLEHIYFLKKNKVET